MSVFPHRKSNHLPFRWHPDDVLIEAASKGHVHVMQWALENGGKFTSTDDQERCFQHTALLKNICENGHAHALEWLLVTHPPILDHISLCDILTRAPVSSNVLDVLALHVDTAKIVEVLQQLIFNLNAASFAPSVVEWCMQRGAQGLDGVFHRMMGRVATAGNAQHMAHYLRLGGDWHAEYFRTALDSRKLSFCQWAHQRGDLELDLSGVDGLPTDAYSPELLAWLASLGVYVRVTAIFKHLADFSPDSLQYIIEHYPR